MTDPPNLSPAPPDRAGAAADSATPALLDTLLATAPFGVAFFDRQLRFARVNGALAELNGLSVEAHLGRRLSELVPDIAGQIEPLIQRVLESGEPLVDIEISGPARAEPGATRHAIASYYPVRVAGGDVLGVGALVVDITARKVAEQRLRDAEARLRTLVEQIPLVVLTTAFDEGNTPLYLSPQIEQLTGYTPAEWLAEEHIWERLIHPADRARVAAEDARTVASREPFRVEYRLIARDGRVVWVNTEAVVVYDETGQPRFWQGFMQDITERKLAEQRLREAEANYRSLVEQIPAVVFADDPEGRTTYMSPQIERLTGYTPADWQARDNIWRTLIHPDDREAVLTESARTDRTGEPFSMEYRLIARDGRVVWVREETVLVAADGERCWQGIIYDITERKGLEARLAHQAFHDALTDLPNRALLLDRLGQALAQARRRRETLAVLFLDLDDFKVVNDTLGHDVGDALLVEVAGRLRECLRAEDTAARFGGDEFAFLLRDLPDRRAAGEVAARILAVFRRPFAVGGRELAVSASLGVALSEGGDAPDDLLRHADIAMYRAKGLGKQRYAVYEAAAHAGALARMELRHDLQAALERDEFTVRYQLRLALATGAVVGVAASPRWRHPRRGLLPPEEFMPLAEEAGLSAPLGLWLLDEVCRQAGAWQPAEPLELHIALSARQLLQTDLAVHLAAALAESGLPAERLTLALPERALQDDAEALAPALLRVAGLGARLAIDDFGLGYAALARLAHVPLRELTLHPAIVADLGRAAASDVIAGGMLGVARALGLRVAAAGVATAAQLARLRELGCDIAHGDLFAAPVPAEQLPALLAADLWPAD